MDRLTIPDDAVFIAVVGSRDFFDLWMVRAVVDCFDPVRHVLVSGGALGVDSIAEDQAKFRKVQTMIFKPDYEEFGKSAPFVRNEYIVNQSDYVIFFWDGVSKGTYHTMKVAQRTGTPYVIYGPATRE